jgi:hypothetical protein
MIFQGRIHIQGSEWGSKSFSYSWIA